MVKYYSQNKEKSEYAVLSRFNLRVFTSSYCQVMSRIAQKGSDITPIGKTSAEEEERGIYFLTFNKRRGTRTLSTCFVNSGAVPDDRRPR